MSRASELLLALMMVAARAQAFEAG